MIKNPQEILKKIRRLELKTRRLVNSSFAGQYHSVFRGRGMNYEDVRPYQLGDDTRAIDWNVTARLGAPYRKRFVEERDLSVMFVFEDAVALQFGSAGRTRRDTLLETVVLLMLVSAFGGREAVLVNIAGGLAGGDRVRIDLRKRRVDVLIADAELSERRAELAANGGYRIPRHQTPWQEIQRGMVDELSAGMVLKPAVRYRRILRTHGVPRDNH
jgi:hypothetical protein